MYKNNEGITLIALIITIIVMIILVGVTVNVALNGGLFTRTKEASIMTSDEALRERLIPYIVGSIDENGTFHVEKFRDDISTLDEEKEYFGNNTVIGKKFEVDINGNITPVTLIEMTKGEANRGGISTNSNGKITNCDPIGTDEVKIPYKIGDEFITIIGYRSMSMDGTIIWGDPEYKDFVISYGIQIIEDNAFYKNVEIRTIEIPKSVEKIGTNVFTGCTNLEKIVKRKQKDSLDLINSGLTQEQIANIIWEP